MKRPIPSENLKLFPASEHPRALATLDLHSGPEARHAPLLTSVSCFAQKQVSSSILMGLAVHTWES